MRPDETLSAADRADVARVQSALDRLRGFRARFVQTSADQASSAGTVWYDPGRLRLQYDTPGRMTVVASGSYLVAHRDSDGSTTRIALSGNPLGLLLRQPLRLSGAIQVTNVQRRPGILQVSLARTANPAQGLLSLIFADQPDGQPGGQPGRQMGGQVSGLRLIGLELEDARHARTRFRLFDSATALAFPPDLFTPPAS